MQTLQFVILYALFLLTVWLFFLNSRANHPSWAALEHRRYAHRGLHCSADSVPENSLAAFRRAIRHGYGAELDVHLMKDGHLAVIHDASLLRTAGVDVQIEDLTAEDLKNYRLEGTEHHIPLLEEVLPIFAGKAPLIIELKAERGNHAQLAEATCTMLDRFRVNYCIESFDPRCITWLRKNRPDIIRGQLSENFFRDRTDLSDTLKFLLTHNLANFLSRPDFIAYKFADRNSTPSNWLCRKLWRVQGVSWTLRNKEDHDTALKEGWLSIFEGFRP